MLYYTIYFQYFITKQNKKENKNSLLLLFQKLFLLFFVLQLDVGEHMMLCNLVH